jgi:hypothetical protein
MGWPLCFCRAQAVAVAVTQKNNAARFCQVACHVHETNMSDQASVVTAQLKKQNHS